MSDITYEELIPADLRITFLFSMRRISSDITYEELIRPSCCIGVKRLYNVGHYL